MPVLDEPVPPSMGKYSKPHTLAWAKKVASFDGYVFVTPEYNHAPSASLKNAIDFVYGEWNNKAARYVGFGAEHGGTRAVEHLRQVMGELQIADVRAQVAFSLYNRLRELLRPQAEPYARDKPEHDAGPARVVGRRDEERARRQGGCVTAVAVDKEVAAKAACNGFLAMRPCPAASMAAGLFFCQCSRALSGGVRACSRSGGR